MAILQIILNGLTYGALLFVVASGFTLIFGLARVVNLSHGAFYMFGGYVGYSVCVWAQHLMQTRNSGLAWTAGVLAAGLAGALLALVLSWLLKTVKGELPQTLLTLGLAIMVGDICLWIWGGLPVTLAVPRALKSPVEFFGMMYPAYRLFIIVIAVAIAALLYFLLFWSQFGRLIRAGVDNREMVSALGVNIDRLFLSIFLLGGFLTGIAGAIGGSYLALSPGTGFQILTVALFVVIIGGLGSLLGSGVGALIVGLVDSFGRVYFSQFAIFLLSATVIAILGFRTQGLFGRKE